MSKDVIRGELVTSVRAILIFSFMFGLIGVAAYFSVSMLRSQYHDTCIQSHVESIVGYTYTTTYNGTYYDYTYAPFNITKTVCDVYALTRNATSEGN